MRPPWWLPVVLALGCQPEDPPDQVQPLDPVDPEWIGSGDEPSEILFDPVSIPDLHIELSEDALAALQNDPHDYTEGVFTFDERVFEPIGVRLMGVDPALGSDHKPSFKLKFDESVASGEFLGLRELQLREMAADASMMRERLGYMVFREAGVPASRAHHARVFVNGECYGLYANVENVDRRLVGRWFVNAGGSLFESVGADFSEERVEDFDHKSGPDDRAAIRGLADALEYADPDAALAEAEQYVDLEAFVRFWATSAVVGQLGSYPYLADDFYLYLDPESGVLHFLPWGVDEGLEEVDVFALDGLLAARCAESSTCLDDWTQAIWEILDLAEAIDWLAAFDEIAAQIEIPVAEDDHAPHTPADIAADQTSLRTFIESRRAAIEAQLGNEVRGPPGAGGGAGCE